MPDDPRQGIRRHRLPRERHYLIAETAYLIAEQRGFQRGDALDDWLKAEASIDGGLSAET